MVKKTSRSSLTKMASCHAQTIYTIVRIYTNIVGRKNLFFIPPPYPPSAHLTSKNKILGFNPVTGKLRKYCVTGIMRKLYIRCSYISELVGRKRFFFTYHHHI